MSVTQIFVSSLAVAALMGMAIYSACALYWKGRCAAIDLLRLQDERRRAFELLGADPDGDLCEWIRGLQEDAETGKRVRQNAAEFDQKLAEAGWSDEGPPLSVQGWPSTDYPSEENDEDESTVQ